MSEQRTGEPVTIVTVTYSSGDHLMAFLDSLPEATARPYRVVLVDNGSTDGAPEKAAERSEIELIHSGGNVGYGRGANIGVDAAATEWVVVVNPDIVWRPGSLDTLLNAGIRWPRGGAFGPAILTAEGDLYPSARALPSLGRGVGHALCGWWWPGNPWTRTYRQERGTPTEGAVGWLSGSCLVLRREAFLAVHGFDPSYFMYFEDVDLGDRLGAAGWLNVYVPDAVVEHSGGHATSKAGDVMVREHHRSAYRYLARRYAGPGWLPVRLALRLGLGARSALSQVIGRVGRGARPTRSGDVLEEHSAGVVQR